MTNDADDDQAWPTIPPVPTKSYLVFHDGMAEASGIGQSPEPLTHHVWIHDMAMIASHDVPCFVCWRRSAIFCREMTPGRYAESWQPCDRCQDAGWSLQRREPSWWRGLFARLLLPQPTPR